MQRFILVRSTAGGVGEGVEDREGTKIGVEGSDMWFRWSGKRLVFVETKGTEGLVIVEASFIPLVVQPWRSWMSYSL